MITIEQIKNIIEDLGNVQLKSNSALSFILEARQNLYSAIDEENAYLLIIKEQIKESEQETKEFNLQEANENISNILAKERIKERGFKI